MPEQLCVILFADITGSTQLYESLGDEAAKSLIVGLQKDIAAVVADCGGTVREIIGDEVMASFADAGDGARCASRIHECAGQHGTIGTPPFRMRIGMHYGPVLVEKDRIFGDTVNIAARVAAIAQGGQTITTETLVEQSPEHWQAVARRYDVTKVKGKKDALVIYDMPWRQTDLTAIKPQSTSRKETGLRLCYGETSVDLSMNDGTFSIGRDQASDLVVNAESVSRQHATIEVIRDRFVVTDKSTNGTHVYMANGQTFYLRREQIPIWGSGRLALGALLDERGDHLVQFLCTDDPRKA